MLVPSAASAGPGEPNLQLVDDHVRQGQEAYNRREFALAARHWQQAVELLPDVGEHSDNRTAIYEYIADAYEKAVAEHDDLKLIQEGLRVLDAYAAAVDPGHKLPDIVMRARTTLRARLAAAQRATAADRPDAGPSVPAPSQPGPELRRRDEQKKGLLIAGGIVTAASAGMFVLLGTSIAQTSKREDEFQANRCDLDQPVGVCEQIYSRGVTSDRLAVTSLITGPLLLGAGMAMLLIAARRKSSRHAWTPSFGARMVGATWSLRF
ncbi:hypothetical protein [Nannocystis pusilla]|uniref:Tetratricopeptide repeat protein n=1 Tax=Nannocystis pusilla TaxID=889268 RepID=A0ABS7TUH6_9BACT|nr:hypothetical protein [Nannocystis pusilla]MBZ5711875.1 hypothetical protein [Nannocystis pusilla]